MKNIIYLLAAFICLLTINEVTAQENEKKDAFWGNTADYFTQQAAYMFNLVDQALTDNPPQQGNSLTRELALCNLDLLLHDTNNDNSAALLSFLDSRMHKVIEDLEYEKPQKIKIYKLYNDGFIIHTPSTTVAIDIVRGTCNGRSLIPDSLMQQIVSFCDILFITHNHEDHADAIVAKMFIQANKPVIGPSNLWPDNSNILHWRIEDGPLNKQINGLNIKIFPGHQDDLLNNIYLISTKEGKNFIHIGDQYNENDMEWIKNLRHTVPQPDYLIINCWAYQLPTLVGELNPKCVITGHENEMGHTIDHREAFWLTFQKMKNIRQPYVVMGWGEWFVE